MPPVLDKTLPVLDIKPEIPDGGTRARTVSFHVDAPALIVFADENVFGVKLAVLKKGDNFFTSTAPETKTEYKILDLAQELLPWKDGGNTIPPVKNG